MNVMRKFRSLILRLSRIICPRFHDQLCLRWNLNTTSYWDQLYSSNNAKEHWSSDVRLQFYDLAATALPRTPATILDVGSGFGSGGRHLMDIYQGWQIEGLDFSVEGCRKAVIKTHCVDLQTEQLPGEYDYILAVETLEHMTRAMEVLEKLYKAARKAVIVTVPYKGDKSTTHPASFDEQSFSKYPNAETKLSERKQPDGSIKIDMLVVLKKSANS